MANPNPVARVSAIQGQCFAKDDKGNLRQLHVDDNIYEHEILVTGVDSHVELVVSDDRRIDLRANETLTIDSEVAGDTKPDAADAALSNGGKEADKIIQTIKQGASLDGLLEETSALDSGTGGVADAGGGPSFVRLLRIPEEQLSQNSYDFEPARQYVPGEEQRPPANLITLSAWLDPDSDSAVKGDNLTNDSTPTILGKGSPGARIDVTIPGTNEHLTARVSGDGHWSVTPTIAIPDGAINVTVVETKGSKSETGVIPIVIDTVTDFNVAAPAAGGDILDLRDLLVGESHVGNDPAKLGDYLSFSYVAGTGTTINVKVNDTSSSTQSIVLQGVDLTGGGVLNTDLKIIQDLLNKGKLVTD